MDIGVYMHSGTIGESDCVESCYILPFLSKGLTCGPCEEKTKPTSPTPNPPAPSPSKSYDIYLDMPGVPTTDRWYFQQARNKIEAAVTIDLPEIASSRLRRNELMTSEGCNFPEIIDDLYICAYYAARDGPGGAAGFAAPVFLRPQGGRQTIVGTMGFDTDDLASLKQKNDFTEIVSANLILLEK
jgi:hypothetical protein